VSRVGTFLPIKASGSPVFTPGRGRPLSGRLAVGAVMQAAARLRWEMLTGVFACRPVNMVNAVNRSTPVIPRR